MNYLFKPPLWFISILYYIVWIGTIQLAANSWPLSGAILHFSFGIYLISLHPRARIALLKKAGFGSCLGYVFDSGLVYLGVISFPPFSSFGSPSPLWMVSLWFTFSVLLNGALHWLLRTPWIAVLLGLIGGPISYLGGAQTGAMLTHGPLWRVALMIGLGWAGLMWLASWGWSSRILTQNSSAP